MDEKQGETRAEAPDRAAGPPDPGTRAAAYLDLWEQHVAHAALRGPAPRTPPQGS